MTVSSSHNLLKEQDNDSTYRTLSNSQASLATWLRCRSCHSGYFAASGSLQPVGLWDPAHEAAPEGIRQRSEVKPCLPGLMLASRVPNGATGEVRTTCPQCSPSRRKSRDACLAVNADAGTWYCHHCGWRGGLHRRLQPSTMTSLPHPPARPDERHRAALARVRAEALPLAAGDPVVTYLAQRGITLPLQDLPSCGALHPRLPYRHEDQTFTYHPAMVARVDDPAAS